MESDQKFGHLKTFYARNKRNGLTTSFVQESRYNGNDMRSSVFRSWFTTSCQSSHTFSVSSASCHVIFLIMLLTMIWLEPAAFDISSIFKTYVAAQSCKHRLTVVINVYRKSIYSDHSHFLFVTRRFLKCNSSNHDQKPELSPETYWFISVQQEKKICVSNIFENYCFVWKIY